MGLFKKHKQKNTKFVSEESYKQEFKSQLVGSMQILKVLRQNNITPDKKLKLEFFFYTNTEQKAEQLAKALSELTYEVTSNVSPTNKKQLVVTGWTDKMMMDDETVLKWTGEMVKLGYSHDAAFDGWGTDPSKAE